MIEPRPLLVCRGFNSTPVNHCTEWKCHQRQFWKPSDKALQRQRRSEERLGITSFSIPAIIDDKLGSHHRYLLFLFSFLSIPLYFTFKSKNTRYSRQLIFKTGFIQLTQFYRWAWWGSISLPSESSSWNVFLSNEIRKKRLMRKKINGYPMCADTERCV